VAEISLVDYVRRGLRRRALAVKHNDLMPGIADLSLHFPAAGRGGTRWVETKASVAWPARPGTRVWWPHYTEHQALFLRQRQGYLLARIGREYLLFDGDAAWAQWEARGWPREMFRARAQAHWAGRINWLEFEREIL